MLWAISLKKVVSNQHHPIYAPPYKSFIDSSSMQICKKQTRELGWSAFCGECCEVMTSLLLVCMILCVYVNTRWETPLSGSPFDS